MIRGFAPSLFFVTFPFWVEGLTTAGLPGEIGFPLGVFPGWSVNLLVAEWWFWRSRPRKSSVRAGRLALETSQGK